MNNEKKAINISESQMLYIEKEFLDKYRFYFGNVCECACLVIALTNGDVVLYHAFLNDSENDIIKKLSELGIKNDDNIDDLFIFGGNINNRWHPCEDSDIFRKNGENVYKDKASMMYDKISNDHHVPRRDIISDNINTSEFYKLNSILYSKKDIATFDKMNTEKASKIGMHKFCNDIYSKPEYKDFSGPQNLEKLRNVASRLNYIYSHEMRVPRSANIEYTKKEFQIIEKPENTIALPEPITQRPMSPNKTGYQIFCNKMSDLYPVLETDERHPRYAKLVAEKKISQWSKY